ncbi:MAG: glycosyltransferase family 39 protein, partial [Nitrososphaeraceae archaeon]|nr:glycosyltransferase family 39 protein [Nitrososphaeraceae archaeon]
MIDKKLFRNNYFQLSLIVLTAIVLRFFFSAGHVFSDDAYYSYLSKVIFDEKGFSNYLGYPIFKLRSAHLLITNIFYNIFGYGEFATLVFPFLISIASIFLAYIITELITKNKSLALLSSLLKSFFPVDIVFGSINFVDLHNAFFINSGILLLFVAHKKESFGYSVLAGLLFAFSLQFKETFYFHWVLLAVLFIYLALKKKIFVLPILISLIVTFLYLIAESVIYFIAYNNFFYRLSILQANYIFSYYDFFPYTAQKLSGYKNYIKNLFDQLILINGRSIFLRRFYLFIPIIASIQSIINIKKRDLLITTYWFAGLALMMLAFTTSFWEYKPLDLKRSWYIYPLILPAIILTTQFISRFNFKIK